MLVLVVGSYNLEGCTAESTSTTFNTLLRIRVPLRFVFKVKIFHPNILCKVSQPVVSV